MSKGRGAVMNQNDFDLIVAGAGMVGMSTALYAQRQVCAPFM